ncbi:MAG TPA: rhodanese-like domain-containing protein [bacterium]|nr:rhodanese-like domain-containing protein [bacterium]
MSTFSRSRVSEISAAEPAQAVEHFEKLLAFETDCWDVNASLEAGHRDFVLLDVRSPEAYAAGHVPGAVNMPHARIVERNLAELPAEALFVVYCSATHCNGADRAAVRLARLGRRVKKMLGGVAGWKYDGFPVVTE